MTTEDRTAGKDRTAEAGPRLDEQRAAIDVRWENAARALAGLDADGRDQFERLLARAHPSSLLSVMREQPGLAIDVHRLAALALDELLLRAKGGR